jgi:hypothetical protein
VRKISSPSGQPVAIPTELPGPPTNKLYLFNISNYLIYISVGSVSQLKNAHFELCPQEVCLRPYLPSGIASHIYFLKWPREGRSVYFDAIALQWFFIFRVLTVFFWGRDIITTLVMLMVTCNYYVDGNL